MRRQTTNKGRGNTYTAILTTSSIKQAPALLPTLQRRQSGEGTVRHCPRRYQALSSRIFRKSPLPIPSRENGEKDSFNQDQMKESMQDYNAMFGTQYTMEQLGAYNSNINDRLARKKKICQVREAQLDLVIVVDRLLTASTRRVCRRLSHRPQAHALVRHHSGLSRTNRLYDNQKRFGQIVIFQVPAHFKKAADDAMRSLIPAAAAAPASKRRPGTSQRSVSSRPSATCARPHRRRTLSIP